MRSNQPRAGSLKVTLCPLSALHPYFGSLSVLAPIYALFKEKSQQDERSTRSTRPRAGSVEVFLFFQGNITRSPITLYLTRTLINCLLLLHKTWYHRRHRGSKRNWHWDHFALSWSQQPRLFMDVILKMNHVNNFFSLRRQLPELHQRPCNGEGETVALKLKNSPANEARPWKSNTNSLITDLHVGGLQRLKCQ